MRVGVLGATGRLGRGIVAALPVDERGPLVARRHGVEVEGSRTILLDDVRGDPDVWVDASSPEALRALLDRIGSHTPLVTGTTGLPAELTQAIDRHAQTAPVLQAANFSTGVALLQALVASAAALLRDADVEVIEAHHRGKVDAPSGTALALARAAAEARGLDLGEHAVFGRDGRTGPRPIDDIGIHAVRGGDTVGDHTVWLASDGERLELRHVATSRTVFAVGAVRAARWLVGRPPGRYAMRDVVSR